MLKNLRKMMPEKVESCKKKKAVGEWTVETLSENSVRKYKIIQ